MAMAAGGPAAFLYSFFASYSSVGSLLMRSRAAGSCSRLAAALSQTPGLTFGPYTTLKWKLQAPHHFGTGEWAKQC